MNNDKKVQMNFLLFEFISVALNQWFISIFLMKLKTSKLFIELILVLLKVFLI